MTKRNLPYLLVFILVAILTSCVEDLDFDQADTIVLEPVVTSSILFTEVEASRFSENGSEIQTVSDAVENIEIFEDEFVNDNLVKAELVFEVTNSINRIFSLQIDFLDDEDILQYTLTFDASQSSTGNDIITNFTEVFEDESLEALKRTDQIIITLTVLPSSDGSMLNEDSTGRVMLKSKGIFYLNINVES